MTAEEAIEEINELGEMQENWDGYGASEMKRESIQAAKILASELKREIEDVTPCNDGSIAFQWYRGNRFLNIQIERAEESWFLDSEIGADSRHETGSFRISQVGQIQAVIDRFLVGSWKEATRRGTK